jgi:hypothetical protein
MNEMSIAPTLSASASPSPVPRPGGVDHVDVGPLDLELHAAHRLGTCVSGTKILAIISVPGAVMITASAGAPP